MQLPFTRAQFFDLFAAYNATLWPALVLLWIASAVISVLLLSSPRRSDRWIAALLAAHWIWSAVAYHAVFFTRINPAAWLFAALFLLQAALFIWWGFIQQRLTFAPWRSRWAPVGWALVAYSLVYPAINAAQHLTWSRIPAFGVPCPTTIFTAGLLMLASGVTWRLTMVPVVWSLIGGSAAFLLDVRADYVLPIAGLALAVFTVQSARGRDPRERVRRGGSTAVTEPHPIAVRLLLGLLLLQGLSGLGGGFGLAADPTGAAVGLDPEWLDGSPFADYLIPGVILLIVLGIGPLIVMVGIFKRLRWAWMASLLVGLALIIWIIVEVLIVGYIARPPLQLIYGLIGCGIVATTLLPSVRGWCSALQSSAVTIRR